MPRRTKKKEKKVVKKMKQSTTVHVVVDQRKYNRSKKYVSQTPQPQQVVSMKPSYGTASPLELALTNLLLSGKGVGQASGIPLTSSISQPTHSNGTRLVSDASLLPPNLSEDTKRELRDAYGIPQTRKGMFGAMSDILTTPFKSNKKGGERKGEEKKEEGDAPPTALFQGGGGGAIPQEQRLPLLQDALEAKLTDYSHETLREMWNEMRKKNSKLKAMPSSLKNRETMITNYFLEGGASQLENRLNFVSDFITNKTGNVTTRK